MEEKNYVTYEYKTATVKKERQARTIDLYEAFGWEVTSVTTTATGDMAISLKRDRKIKHRQELVKIEKQAQDTLDNVYAAERSKTSGGNAFAFTFGTIAALISGGGMSLVMTVSNSVPALVGGILLGVLGVVLCSINYPIFKKIVDRRIKKIQPTIDENEEKLANLLEKGNELLSADLI